VVSSFSNRKGQALLAYLAVERRRAHSREALASLLWARTGEERARHNLRQSLAKVRRALGDVVAADGERLRLDLAACDSDVRLFEEHAGGGDAACLQRALDQYRGELLEGFDLYEEAFSDWLSMARARFRQTACTVAGRLAAIYGAQGERDLAIAVLERLLGFEPADENAHRQLIRALAAQGRRSEALRQYQRCADALRRELGAGPDAETQALHRELRAPQGGEVADAPSLRESSSGGGRAPAVAVLPFDNLSGDGDRYFVDGIAEDLTTALSGFHSLVVIARGSSFTYRGTDVPEKRIAGELGAQYLVRGSVQRADKRVRINVQLMDADAGLQVWGHRYDREMEDVFVLQDEIISTLVCTLAGRVEAARLRYARRAAPERLDAYDLLLRGKDHHHRFTAEDCAICIDMFRRAIERDPDYAVAHAWLACAIGQAMVFGLDDVPRLVDQSQAAAERGLELDENESECHRILAQVQLTRRNLGRALWHQERALLLNPNDDRIVCAQGEMLAFAGRAEEAEHWVRKAMRLNPYHPQRYWTHLARALFHQARYDEALGALNNIGRPRMDDLCYRAAAAEMAGEEDLAADAARALLERHPEFDAETFTVSSAYSVDAFRDALAVPLSVAIGRLPGAVTPMRQNG
jgi:TolB-like protein/predicted Zn-dependent protease